MASTLTAHVYSKAVPVPDDSSTFYTGHLVFADDGELLCLGCKTYAHEDDIATAAKTALRDGLTDVHTQFAPTTTIVHEPDIRHPALELGRLPHHIRKRIKHVDIEFTRSQENNRQKLLYGLVNQPTDAALYTDRTVSSPPSNRLYVYTDGSHRNESHTPNRGASTTLGFVVIDETGRLVTLAAQQLDEATESLHAEYLAIKHALDAIQHVAPSAEVLVKTDCNPIERTFNSLSGTDAPPRMQLIAEYIDQALSTFSDARVKAIDRDENEFADALADAAHDTSFDYRPFEQAVEVAEAEYTYTV